ncbi:MAG: type III-A CRISPR-associated protein Cas10/Csm1 [Actinobacteria bacterium]|nr:type III-A CRISPR-associated protein Cas10/Csm1 [Actinomycetota bacterium]
MNRLDQIIIGALLHDIGKFMQRAGVDNKFKNNEREKSRVCKRNAQHYYTHYHSLYTLAFFDFYEKYLPKPTERFERPEDNVSNFASCHHNPMTDIGWIIAEADRLSSGSDRTQEEDREDMVDIQGRSKLKTTRLVSIFSEINLTGRVKSKDSFVYSLNPLKEYDDSIFPMKKTDVQEDLTVEYSRLWDAFEKEIEKITSQNIDLYIQHLYYVLQKYTWCIPSSTVDFPDISLYDHSVTTAAIASSLYLFHKYTGTLKESCIRDRTTSKFLMVSGDLSGIQNYIYNIYGSDSRGASKALRCRSLYLELLNEVCARYVVDYCGLHFANILYSCGGKFLIFAPNLPEFIDKISELKKFIGSWFKNKFSGELALNLAFVELCGNHFDIRYFPMKFTELTQKTEQAKNRRFFEVLLREPKLSNFIVGYSYSEGEKSVCKLCGKYPSAPKSEGYCDFCSSFIKIGGRLPQVNTLAYSRRKVATDSSGVYLSFFDDKYYIYFYSEEKLKDISHFFSIYSLFSDLYYPRKPLAAYVPRDVGSGITLTFEEISKYSCEYEFPVFYEDSESLEGELSKGDENLSRCGEKMLSVLRADVDNMGLIFSYGLYDDKIENSKLTVSRYYALSRMFNLFFSGFLTNLIKTNNRFRNIYIVYAGGDDLFLIGPWDTIIEFAVVLQKKFKRYTCLNDDITISAAIGLFKPHFPVRRFASITRDLLERAKEHEQSESKKPIDQNESKIVSDGIRTYGNRINLFNHNVMWDDLKALLREGYFLEREVKKNRKDQSSNVSMAFLYRMLKYHDMYEKYKETGDVNFLRYKYLSVYDLSRNIVNYSKENNEILNKEVVKKLQVLLNEKIEELTIPVYWAIYRCRR